MLYVVPVPIGNLEDITLRAIKLFQQAQIILCEDGRQSSKLLHLLEIANKPQYVNISKNHEFNYSKIRQILLQTLEEKETELKVLLVSDAGMAGLSDPGWEVIKLALELGVNYTVLPGPNAVIPAVVASGFVPKEFHFMGFLPIKKGRQKEWERIKQSPVPVVLYESVHRIGKFLEQCQQNLQAERKICICNDLSKMYERIWTGRVAELQDMDWKEKGEFVIVIDGV